MTRSNWKVRIAIALFSTMLLMMGLAACTSGNNPKATTLYGQPWVSSIFVGNLPENTPKASDDLYTCYAYDYASKHQDGTSSSVMGDTQGELRQSVEEVVKDRSQTNASLDQLRIFYDQASDAQALEAAGADELKPYLKAIADTTSLDELEELLLSEDFPFTPWIDSTLSSTDMMSDMCIGITPHMLFSDAETGAEIYLDTDDATVAAARKQIRDEKTVKVEDWISMLSIGDPDKNAENAEAMFELEKTYCKHTSQEQYLIAEYGKQTQTVKAFTFDELAVEYPNFPIRETLAKLGEDKGDSVMVVYPEWLAAFNDIWTEDNFEQLKAMTEVKVLAECSDFLSPSLFTGTQARLGQVTPTSDDVAWRACDRTDTFAQLLAKTYVEHTLGEEAVDDLTKLSNDLIDAYIELVKKTDWLNAQSREKIMDKIDNMALNVLYPDGGYFDYSGLELVPTEEGGTLLGNYLKLKAYNEKCKADLIGQPARASIVWMNIRPTTQNCFYDPTSNSINIFPGFVTSAVYEQGATQEELLGGMGFIMGHEISHAFDYSWSQFDAYGRPDPVFTEDDVSDFVALRDKLADYYSTIEIAPGKNVNGITVSAEAAADLSGMQAIVERGHEIEGFDYVKMFECLAKTWAGVYPQASMDVLLQDFHAPRNIRINVSAQMTGDFCNAFDVTEGKGMYLAPDQRIIMWGENAS